MENKQFWNVCYEHLEKAASHAGMNRNLGGLGHRIYLFSLIKFWDGAVLFVLLESTHPVLRPSSGLQAWEWHFSIAEKELHKDVRDEESTGDESWEQTQEGDVGDLYQQQLALKTDCRERLDHTNFRFLLWRALAKFPERVEPRSRELSPLFLRFIK
jgi:hypothetical protein